MHQDHAIPWALLAEHIQIEWLPGALDRKEGDKPSRLIPRRLPHQADTLNHFVRVFEDRIIDFASSERKRYPDKIPPLPAGTPVATPAEVEALRSRDLRDRTYENGREIVDGWRQKADEPHQSFMTGYLLQQLDVAEDLTPMLALVQDPQVPVPRWDQTKGHDMYCGRALRHCLRIYVGLNVLAELPEMLHERRYVDSSFFKLMEKHVGAGNSHWEPSVNWDPFWRDVWKRGASKQVGPVRYPGQYLLDVFADLPTLKRYLKRLWHYIYRCEILAHECNSDQIIWQTLLCHTLWDLFNFPIRHIDVKLPPERPSPWARRRERWPCAF